jgi:hypothetical protein
MVHITGEVVIDVAITEVFDTVADERNEPRYNPRTVGAEKVADGPVGADSRLVAEPEGHGRQRRDGPGDPGVRAAPLPSHRDSIVLHARRRYAHLRRDHGQHRLRWEWHMRLVGPMRVLTPVLMLMAPGVGTRQLDRPRGLPRGFESLNTAVSPGFGDDQAPAVGMRRVPSRMSPACRRSSGV